MASKTENPVGPVIDAHPAQTPSHNIRLVGKHVTIVGTTIGHATDLFEGVGKLERAYLWDYMLEGPFETEEDLRVTLEKRATSTEPVYYTILSNVDNEKAIGLGSLLNINIKNRTVEVGHLMYSAALQRTPASTEAMYLIARYAIEDCGFRRYEWKCNALNAPSRKAALRLGFTFEGIFRQHMIVRGRNRDTAWFAMIDSEWPSLRKALEDWLSEDNFDEHGKQRRRLEEFRA